MIEGSQFKTEIEGLLVNKVPAVGANGFVLVLQRNELIWDQQWRYNLLFGLLRVIHLLNWVLCLVAPGMILPEMGYWNQTAGVSDNV